MSHTIKVTITRGSRMRRLRARLSLRLVGWRNGHWRPDEADTMSWLRQHIGPAEFLVGHGHITPRWLVIR